MNKLLSIIIPVYKVEPYINKCLDSLLLYKTDETGKQVLDTVRMEQMDILIINDGTPDCSAEMSREYVKHYPEYFRQIDKENGGHGSVWNMGIKEAQGKYIRFLDSDDWLENLDTLIDKLQTADADLVLTHTLDHCENNELWHDIVRGFEFERVYDMETYDWMGHKGSFNSFLHHSCTFKRELLLPFIPLFLEKQPYDDSVLPMALIYVGKSLVAYDFTVYHYLLDRPGQTMSPEVRKKQLRTFITADQHTAEFLEQHMAHRGTSKDVFLEHRLKRLYRSWYMLSYTDDAQILKEWDNWAKKNNHPISVFELLYRCMPFRIYRLICKMILRR